MSSEKWLSALCVLGFAGAGTIVWMSGDHATALGFFGLVAFFVLAFSYQAYRQRVAPQGGPPDPSVHWRSDASTDSSEQGGSFRYSAGTIVTLRYMAILPALAGPAIYFLSSPRPAGSGLIGLGAFEVLLLLGFYLVYRACVEYAVVVTSDSIELAGLFRKRKFPYASLGKVALLEGGGRGPRYVVALYDRNGKQLCTLSNGVEGFERMVALIKEGALRSGVPYRYRDMWGCWTG